MENTEKKMHRSSRKKIYSIEELEEISASTKMDGKKVVLCHGVFDLLHLGHVRHLEAARREGDILIVTITADKYVNKGPGRPVFTEQLRAEMLGSLEYVDYVGINDDQSAVESLTRIKPHIYVKGSDYKSASDDITGKIGAERETLESHGGKIVFTDEITFSSSTLINQNLGVYEPTLQQYLDERRGNVFLNELIALINKLKDIRVLFIGDAIIDEYQYVTALGKSAKENMIATLFNEKEVFAGGVFAAANHVADFCQNVEIVTCFGGFDSEEQLARDSLKPNVKIYPVYNENAPTTRKTRFVETGYSMRKLFEVYQMDDTPVFGNTKDKLNELIEKRMLEADVVVVTDFGHGLLSKDTIDLLKAKAPFLAVNTQSNSANHGFNLISKYDKADYVCIDGPEARLAVHDKFSSLETLLHEKLPNLIECEKIVVTQGKHGCLGLSGDSGICKVPAMTSTIIDTVGAGDAFFSVTAPLVAAGATMEQIGFLGNAVGAMKVGIVGHRTSVGKVPLIKFLTAMLK